MIWYKKSRHFSLEEKEGKIKQKGRCQRWEGDGEVREGTGSAQRDTVRVDEFVAGGAAGSGVGQPYPQRGDEPGGGDDGITRYSGSTNFVSSLVGAFRRKVWS